MRPRVHRAPSCAPRGFHPATPADLSHRHALYPAKDREVQRHLHEFLDELAGEDLFEPVTPGAWTQARAKLKHSAFIELNRDSVLPVIDGAAPDQPIKRWRGHRLLGVDRSILRLPNSAGLFDQFTAVEVTNHHGPTGVRDPEARLSVVYDLLNRVGLDGRLEPSRKGEASWPSSNWRTLRQEMSR